MFVGWLDRAARWWCEQEVDVDCVDDQHGQHGGGEIELGLGFFDILLW